MDYVVFDIVKQFDDYTVLQYLNYFHLAKSKISFYRGLKTILLNEIEAKLETILHQGDILKLLVIEEIDFLPLHKDIDIVYEDEHLLILNKPVDILVHPDSKEKNGALVNMVAAYFQKRKIIRNVRYVHRLDMQTTGLIIFAKDLLTSSRMNYLISINEVKRDYLAICGGHLTSNNGVIDKPIGEDRHHNQRRRVSNTGQKAVTNYTVLKHLEYTTLVQLQLKTGRTHQIRVHMSSIGHPLAGDELYSGSMRSIKRVALHSAYLDFIHPVTNDKIHLECLMPNDMQKIVLNRE